MNYIYFHEDADGFASAAVIGRYINKVSPRESVAFIPCQHGSKPISLGNVDTSLENTIFILDYSMSSDDEVNNVNGFIEEYGYENSQKIIFIDHHSTSLKLIDMENSLSSAITEQGLVETTNRFSAAILCYFYIDMQKRNITEKMEKNLEVIRLIELEENDESICPYWIRLISDNDIFRNSMEDSKYFALALTNHDLHDMIIGNLGDCLYDESGKDTILVNNLIHEGKSLWDYNTNRNLELMNRSSFEFTIRICVPGQFIGVSEDDIDITGKFICLNAYGNSRVFGDKYYNHDGVCIFNFDGTNFKYTMYSKNDGGFPCHVAALYFKRIFGINGGGHIHAAGWTAPKLLFRKDKNYIADTTGFKEV